MPNPWDYEDTANHLYFWVLLLILREIARLEIDILQICFELWFEIVWYLLPLTLPPSRVASSFGLLVCPVYGCGFKCGLILNCFAAKKLSLEN